MHPGHQPFKGFQQQVIAVMPATTGKLATAGKPATAHKETQEASWTPATEGMPALAIPRLQQQ